MSKYFHFFIIFSNSFINIVIKHTKHMGESLNAMKVEDQSPNPIGRDGKAHVSPRRAIFLVHSSWTKNIQRYICWHLTEVQTRHDRAKEVWFHLSLTTGPKLYPIVPPSFPRARSLKMFPIKGGVKQFSTSCTIFMLFSWSF